MGRHKTSRKCTITKCDRKHRAKGLCMQHYLTNYRIKLMDILGEKKCVFCDFSDIRALQIDHINGGGNREYRKFGSYSVYLYYVKNPEKAKKMLQIVCANCNWIKRHELNENRE